MKSVAKYLIMATLVLPLSAYGVDKPKLAKPVDIPILLSGNFGELRNNHFHSGIDIKTQGRTGLPIYCAENGYVSRIVVSPWGFGRAVYVVHPELGLTTVYGHLQSFSPKIDKPVRDRQYDKESFSVDLEFAPGEIPLKKGEKIALSGNAGSSGGPHLHMDVRDTKTEETLDPLPYYKEYIRDNVAPEVRAIALYPEKGAGVVNNSSSLEVRNAAKFNQPFIAWGKVVPAIKAYDRMTNTSNIYGVKKLVLNVDGKTVYSRLIDRYSFDNTRAVNTLVDYSGVVNGNSWMMWSKVPDSRPLGEMIEADNNGVIDVTEERDYNCEWILMDEHGNTTCRPFVIRGMRMPVVKEEPKGDLFYFDGRNSISREKINVTFPPYTFYDNIYFSMSETPSAEYLSPVYNIGSASMPVAGEYCIEITIDKDMVFSPEKLLLVRLNGNRKTRVDSKYENGVLTASPSALGRFAVTVDTVAPLIKPELSAKWGQRGKVSVIIRDNLSGIASYRGEIDGKFALFELDGKTGRLSFVMDPERFEKGRMHKLEITVTDNCGNTATYKNSFNW